MGVCKKCGLENGNPDGKDCEDASECVLRLKRHMQQIEAINTQLLRMCQAQNDLIIQAKGGFEATLKVIEENPIQRTFERSFFDFETKATKASQAFERIREQNSQRPRVKP